MYISSATHYSLKNASPTTVKTIRYEVFQVYRNGTLSLGCPILKLYRRLCILIILSPVHISVKLGSTREYMNIFHRTFQRRSLVPDLLATLVIA